EYYNGKLFVYDWIRGWIKTVSMLPNGDFDKMESFMHATKFSSPIDMELGPDGRLYVLEYGSGWFSKNADAGIARIYFVAGNRPPRINGLAVERESGLLPFTVQASVDAVDPEKKPLKYSWSVGGTKVETTGPTLVHTLKKGGSYPVSVTVTDEENTVTKSKIVNVHAGNERPEVAIQIKQNSMFYFPGKPVQYAVAVKDKGAPVAMSRLVVSTENAVGFDKAEQPVGHVEAAAPSTAGRSIMLSLDCKACHKEVEKSIGPSFQQVARRYSGKAGAPATLSERIIKGSSGVWGENAMPAHPGLKQSDAAQIVKWVLSLDGKKTVKKETKSLPPVGRVLPPASNKPLIIRAVYTDNGGAGVKPLQATAIANLRSNVFSAEEIKDLKGFSKKDSANVNYLNLPEKSGWIKIPQVDLQTISQLEIRGLRLNNFASNEWSVVLDKPDGENILTGTKPGTNGFLFNLKQQNDGRLRDVYLFYKGEENRRNSSLLKDIRFML
ncbi:MAG TPA: PKD domain-containing protein, partial [Flavisolibacter sp.]|nr:PKD domain-containing protein [Flavisolibacter sp.]